MLLYNAQTGLQANSNKAKIMNGTTYSGMLQLTVLSATQNGSHYCGSANGSYVLIGAGDTDVDFNDYDLADTDSIIPSDGTKMRDVSASASWNSSTGATVSSVWTNFSDAPITVKEVGLVYKFTTGNPYSKGTGILLARSILETPVTIGAGESYAFTYSVSVK